MQHVLVAPFHQGEQHQRRDTAVAGADGRPGANAGLGASADPDERVLYQSRADDFRRAYAVLPYVYQGAVTHYGWLTAGQMMDGLALGESTPGPLIMVVTFVGFVGGYTKAVLGVDEVLLGGIAAACLVTWFTFCPRLSLFSPAGRLLKPPIIKWDLPRRWPPPR